MFITRTSHASPPNQLAIDKHEHLWACVELCGQIQWVLLTMQHTQVDSDGEEVVSFKTVFIRNFTSFFYQKFPVSEGETVQLVAAKIFWPPDEGSHEWVTDEVAKVWMAESDDDPGGPIEVCETKSGSKFIMTQLMDFDVKLKNPKLVFRFDL